MHYWPSGIAETVFQQAQTAVETLQSGDQPSQWATASQAQLTKAQAIRDRLKGKSSRAPSVSEGRGNPEQPLRLFIPGSLRHSSSRWALFDALLLVMTILPDRFD